MWTTDDSLFAMLLGLPMAAWADAFGNYVNPLLAKILNRSPPKNRQANPRDHRQKQPSAARHHRDDDRRQNQ